MALLMFRSNNKIIISTTKNNKSALNSSFYFIPIGFYKVHLSFSGFNLYNIYSI